MQISQHATVVCIEHIAKMKQLSSGNNSALYEIKSRSLLVYDKIDQFNPLIVVDQWRFICRYRGTPHREFQFLRDFDVGLINNASII